MKQYPIFTAQIRTEKMATQKYVSDIKVLSWSNDIVYDRLSNFETLNFLFNPENLERAKQQLGDQANKFNIDEFMADSESCSFKISPIGTISLRIVERDENKTVKIVSDQGPINFTIWVQTLPLNEYSSKLRLTIHTELNMVMKMMLDNKLSKGINQVADAFTQIPFGSIPSSNSYLHQ